MLLFAVTLWKLIPHSHTVSRNYISTARVVLFFMSLNFHQRCIYAEGLLSPPANMCRVWRFSQDVVSWTGRTFAPSVWSCFALNTMSPTFTHTHLHKHIFSFWKWQAPERFDEFAFQSLAPISLSLFFFLSFPLLVFASTFPWAFYYTAKVAIMSPLCLKPNSPVCQRAQLCEDKWT